jgi:ABC-2 type transport system permease protein
VLGVVLVLIATLFTVYAAGRIFRVGILLQGKGASFGDMMRWVIRG